MHYTGPSSEVLVLSEGEWASITQDSLTRRGPPSLWLDVCHAEYVVVVDRVVKCRTDKYGTLGSKFQWLNGLRRAQKKLTRMPKF